MKKLKVMETYVACQGEGIRIGESSVFVRLFGCNMRCSWCDTAYSINTKEWRNSELPGKPYSERTVRSLTSIIDAHKQGATVITGGEPTLYGTLLVDLLKNLYGDGQIITVETNGSLLPEGLKEWYALSWNKKAILWSVSPKIASSREGEGSTWLDYKVLTWFVENTHCQLKFVIEDLRDLTEAETILTDKLPGNLRDTVIVLQPQGLVIKEGLEAYLTRLAALQEMVRSSLVWQMEEVRVLPQLHVLMHGQKRYV